MGNTAHNLLGTFALSSGICCHLLAKHHAAVGKSWYENKWFWAGFFGNLPALVAFLGHIILSRQHASHDET